MYLSKYLFEDPEMQTYGCFFALIERFEFDEMFSQHCLYRESNFLLGHNGDQTGDQQGGDKGAICKLSVLWYARFYRYYRVNVMEEMDREISLVVY